MSSPFGSLGFFALLVVAALAAPASAQLEEAWLAVHDGVDGDDDQALALALDDEGNVHITGFSIGAETGSDYATVKFAPDGKELWSARYNGPRPGTDWQFGWDGGTGIAVDEAGNVYVTGASGYSCPGLRGCFHSEFATLKYDAAGTELWVARNDRGLGGALVLDGSGGILVGGPGGVAKLDPDGNELWAASRDDLGSVRAIAVDASGNVHVTGSRFVTVKYDPSGKELWAVRSDEGLVSGGIEPGVLALDGTGNVYVTGTTTSGGVFTSTGFDYVTVKYDAAGHELWVARYDGPGRPGDSGTSPNKNDYARAVAVDGAGNVYVTGQSIAAVWNFDHATVKYDAGGKELWVARYSGGDVGARALALDPAGTIYVTGGKYTVRYDADGTELSVTPHDFFQEAMALDEAGNVYLAGWRQEPHTRRDSVAAKYSPASLQHFRRGDANVDGSQDISDAISILSHLFSGTPEPPCRKSLDIDDSGTVEITDPIFLLQWLFLDGSPPGGPFADCGLDPTSDFLPCGLSPPCR